MKTGQEIPKIFGQLFRHENEIPLESLVAKTSISKAISALAKVLTITLKKSQN